MKAKIRKNTLIIFFLILVSFPLFSLFVIFMGCSTTNTVATVKPAMSAWLEGKVTQDVGAPLFKVIQAVALALRALELNITKTDIKKNVAQIIGEYVDNRTIWIDLRSISELSTHLEIRVSVQGNKGASYRILEKMQEYL